MSTTLLYGIEVNDRPVIMDHQGTVASLLVDWLDTGWGAGYRGPSTWQDSRRQTLSGAMHAVHLPRLHYQPTPHLSFHQLFWPIGATRWGQLVVLVTLNDARRILVDAWNLEGQARREASLRTASWHVVPKQSGEDLLRVQASTVDVHCRHPELDVTIPMHVADYRLVSVPLAADTPLVAIRLVDERFLWQYQGFGGACDGRPATGPPSPSFPFRGQRGQTWWTWTELFDALLAQVGVTSYALGAYGYGEAPDQIEFSRPYESVGTLLDAACASTGMRLVRTLQGDVLIHDPYTADTYAGTVIHDRINNTDACRVLAGASRTAGPRADRLLVAFPRNLSGHVACGADRWFWMLVSHNVANAWGDSWPDPVDELWDAQVWPSAYGTAGAVDTVFCSMHAHFNVPDDDETPRNYTELKAVANNIARSRHVWTQRALMWDYVQTAIHRRQITAFDDYILYDFGTEQPVRLSTAVSPATDDADMEVSLARHYPRRLTTRFVSCDEQCHTQHAWIGHDEVPVCDDHAIFQIDEEDWLEPGGSARATWMVYDDDSQGWVQGNTGHWPAEAEIHDPQHIACALEGEKVECRWNGELNRWDVCTHYGLRRYALVTQEGGILAGSSGTAEIYHNDTGSGREVTVWLVWMDMGLPLREQHEIAIWYNSGEQRWLVDGAEC